MINIPLVGDVDIEDAVHLWEHSLCRKSLDLPLNVAVNLKLSLKIKSMTNWANTLTGKKSINSKLDLAVLLLI